MKPNAQQLKAIRTCEGPILVLAGAGSGKTTVLSERAKYLISERNADPSNMLVVTFTTKSAEEMKERISRAVGEEKSESIWMDTFHSICLRILREEADKLSAVKEGFSVYDAPSCKNVMRKILKDDLNLDTKQVTPHGMLYYVSMLKNELIDAEVLITGEKTNPHMDWDKTLRILETKIPALKKSLIADVYERYQRKLSALNAVDFDDLISHCIRLFDEHPKVLEKYQDKFRYIMVDEYQDTNRSQYALVNMLAKKYRNLAVVGDDFQSIYAFRGSDIRNILNFDQDYPETKIIKLEENYRCSPVILRAANSIIARNENQMPKILFTSKKGGERIGYYFASSERDEARFVVNEISRMLRKGRSFNELAILFRTNNQSKHFEEFFMRMSVPYQVVGGLKFLDRAEIRDLLAALEYFQKPKDIGALCGAFCALHPFFDKQNAQAFFSSHGAVSDFFSLGDKPPITLADDEAAQVSAFRETLGRYFAARGKLPIARLIKMLIADTGYLSALAEQNDEKLDEKLESIDELIAIADAAEESDGSLDAFFNHLSVFNKTELATDRNAIKLMTFHSAKGLEFPVVFMVGMEEGIIPHEKSGEGVDLEEERRLCYVGVTRAKEKLYFTHCRSRKMWGRDEECPPSRFLYEFDDDLFDGHHPLRKLS